MLIIETPFPIMPKAVIRVVLTLSSMLPGMTKTLIRAIEIPSIQLTTHNP